MADQKELIDGVKRKILVAYDGSELSKAAVEEAKRQSKIMPETEVHIVTVVTPGISTNSSAASGNLSMKDTEKIYPQLNKIQAEMIDEGIQAKIKIITDFSQKNPGIAICDYAEEMKMNQIIVGSRGLSNFKALFLGSVSNSIVQRAKCHVLVIK